LSEHDLATLVTTRTGSQAPAAFVQALWTSTGGNPFYAGEVVDDLAARGSFDRADDVWHVPVGVRDVIRDRLRTLTPAAREAIACAAILGREIDFALLAQVTDASEHVLVDALEDATATGWLMEARRPGEAIYTFRHPLMREAVITDLPAPRRQQLHLRAADALEAAGLQRAADVAAAAVHLRAAGRLIDRTRAAQASLRAADEAAGMYAWDEAIAHAEAAVAILANAGATPARQAEAAVRTARLVERSGTDYPRAVHHLEAALEHNRNTGNDAAVAEVHSLLGYVLTTHPDVMDIPRALGCFAVAAATISSGQPAFELHRGKAQAAMYGLRTEQGVTAATRALEIAEQLGRDDLRALARSLLACHRFSCGELAMPLTMAVDVWDVAQQLDDPHLMWEAAFGVAWVNNVYLLDPAAGEEWCRRGLAQPRLMTIRHARDGLKDHLAYALASQGAMDSARELVAGLSADAVTHRLLLFLDGDWPAAEGSWARALADDLDKGDLIDAALNACWLGHVRWLLGCESGAVEALRHALTISLDGPHVATELMSRAELARILAPASDDEAAEHLARCDDLLARGEDWRGQAGAVELARGTLASVRGHQDDADAAYDQALAVFTAYKLPWKRAETLRSWARCCALAHRQKEAEERRSAAVQIYDELGAAPPWRRPLMSPADRAHD
jgi:tetratricopeptide (TPR) repeat protein